MNDFKQNLAEIQKELTTYQNIRHPELYSILIKERLRASTLAYNEEINNTSKYLLSRSGNKVLKTLLKMQKNADKEEILKHTKSAEEKIT